RSSDRGDRDGVRRDRFGCGGRHFVRTWQWLVAWNASGRLVGRRVEERPQRDGRPFLAASREHRTAGHRGTAHRFSSRAYVNTASAARLSPVSVSPDLAALGYRAAGVLLLSVVLALLNGSFLTAANLLNVLRQASLTFLIGSGATLVIVAAGI